MTEKEILKNAKNKAVSHRMADDHIAIDMIKLKDDIQYLDGILYRHNNAYECADMVVGACEMVLARVLSIAKKAQA